MKKLILSLALVTGSLMLSAQGVASFKPTGAIVDTYIKHQVDEKTHSVIEAIVMGVDPMNMDVKFKLYGGCTIDESTPLTKNYTLPQTVLIKKRDAGSKLWDFIIHTLQPAKLPLHVAFSKENPCALNVANPKAWAGYGIDYTKPTVVRFGNSGVGFFVAFASEAKEATFELTNVSKEAFAGEIDVEWSADGAKWKNLTTFSSSNTFANGSPITLSLPKEARLVRWVYAVRERQNVNLNNITIQ